MLIQIQVNDLKTVVITCMFVIIIMVMHIMHNKNMKSQKILTQIILVDETDLRYSSDVGYNMN